MSRVTRRSFVGWLSALGTALGLRKGVPEAMAADRVAELPPEAATEALDAVALTGLAEAVLPSELGSDGATRAARAFGRWVSGYRAGAEVLHPYGSGVITRIAADPVGRWRRQLTELDGKARSAHSKAFAALDLATRQALVRQALVSEKGTRLPGPASASHVATALLSHFYGSAEAQDLCYEAQIAKNRCRPLVNTARQPLPLAPRSRA